MGIKLSKTTRIGGRDQVVAVSLCVHAPEVLWSALKTGVSRVPLITHSPNARKNKLFSTNQPTQLKTVWLTNLLKTRLSQNQ